MTNVIRTVQNFERAGVAGLFLEDQRFPKRCGHTAGKKVTGTQEMLPKLRAALDARRDEDLVIMDRTDALGVGEAIRRANLCLEAACDAAFIETPETRDEMRRICHEVRGPLLANIVESGRTPHHGARKLEDMGFALAVWPVSSVFIASRALETLYRTLRETGSTAALHDRMASFDEYMQGVRLPRLREREARYGNG